MLPITFSCSREEEKRETRKFRQKVTFPPCVSVITKQPVASRGVGGGDEKGMISWTNAGEVGEGIRVRPSNRRYQGGREQ